MRSIACLELRNERPGSFSVIAAMGKTSGVRSAPPELHDQPRINQCMIDQKLDESALMILIDLI